MITPLCHALAGLAIASAVASGAEPLYTKIDSNGRRLDARVFPSELDGPRPVLVLMHGFPGNDDDVLGLGRRLSAFGAHVLTFNYSGTLASEGEYTIANSLEDADAAVAYARSAEFAALVDVGLDVNETGLALGGYSFGGGIAMAYAAAHPDIRSIVSIAGTDHAAFARQYAADPDYAHAMDEAFDALMAPAGPVRFAGRAAFRELLDDPDPHDLRALAPVLADRKILLIGALDDTSVAVEDHVLPVYRSLREAGATRVTFVTFQEAHTFANSRESLADAVHRWLMSR